MQATYSPDDNKIRLYADGRLDTETFQRVKAAGFRWAPKQELFVAPAWTPGREDLLIELAGEIDDEDTSLTERAEQRAERFEDYSEKRQADYQRASDAANEYTKPFANGQPILVGHHSEKRARKDQERGNAAMRRALQAFETSEYWQHRATGAIAAAKYKERQDVRARRIKKLEADLRKRQRVHNGHTTALAFWADESLTLEKARHVAGILGYGLTAVDNWSAWDVLRPDGDRYAACPAMTLADVQSIAKANYPKWIAYDERWIAHYNNRLTYERAMLDDSGYIAPPKRVSRAVLPLLNYPGESVVVGEYGTTNTYPIVETTKAALAEVSTSYKGTRVVEDGTHRVRIALGACLGIRRDNNKRHAYYAVFLTDSKQHPRPGTEPESDAAQEVQARINAAGDKIDRNVEAAKRVRANNAKLIAVSASAIQEAAA